MFRHAMLFPFVIALVSLLTLYTVCRRHNTTVTVAGAGAGAGAGEKYDETRRQ